MAGHDGDVGQRLPVVPNDAGQVVHDVRTQQSFMKPHAQVAGDAAGEGTLVECRIVKPDGDGLDRGTRRLRRQRGDQRRVHPARQEDPDRPVRDEPVLDRPAGNALHLVEHLALIHRRLRRERDIPIPLDQVAAARRVKRQPVRRGQRLHPLPYRQRRRHSLIGEEGVDRARIHVRPTRQQREQGVQRGGEGERRAIMRIEEGFLARAVARRAQDAPAAVPDGERELPVRAAHRFVKSPCPDALQQHLSIRPPSPVAPHAERRAQAREVVDLAVERDDVCPVLAHHGLVPGRREVEDREPPRAETDALVQPDATVVRPAILQTGRGRLPPPTRGGPPPAPPAPPGAPRALPPRRHDAAPANTSKYSAATRSHA